MQAKGCYVCFLDSDDYWHPEFLERCTKTIERSKEEVAFVYVSTVYVKNGTDLGLAHKSKRSECAILPNILIRGRPWDTAACLWDKKVLDKHEGWIFTRNWEDYAFDISAALINNRILAINEPLLYVETGGDNRLSEQDRSIIETEKSKSLANISLNLRNSEYHSNSVIKNRVVLHLVNNTIALLDLKGIEQKYIDANIKSLKLWKPFVFVIFIKLLTWIPIKFGLPLLRRTKMNVQKNHDV